MKKTFQQENNELVESYLEHTFFKGWKEGLQNYERLELYAGTGCNLNCKYCYLARYGKDLYPPEYQNPKKILENLEILLDWMIEKKYAPALEFFSGEPFAQKMGFDSLNLILQKFKKAEKKPTQITVPTNYTFLLSENTTKKVENLIKRYKKEGMNISLSASFDGKYCEQNRPFTTGKEKRNDAYYQKCFAFNKKHGYGFHPMVYSELIGNWKKNFLWFQENFKKFGIPPQSIYLLEVRNEEWNMEQIKSFMEFIEFLIEWTYSEVCDRNPEYFMDFLFTKKGYNILTNPFTRVGRGLGCSIQSTFFLRLGDLAMVPCHRTSYSPFVLAKFRIKNKKIAGIESKNPELTAGISSFEGKNAPFCETCPMKYTCSFGCLGSQYEATGDLFSPIPTVCLLEHAKIYAMMKTYKKLNLYGLIYDKISEEKKAGLDIFQELMDKNYAK